MRHGKGALRFANGNEYTGSWVEDIKEGQGRFLWAEQGNTYAGGFQKGVMHGLGTYNFEDGTNFKGQYVNGQRRGRGVLRLPDGTRQVGVWYGSSMLPVDSKGQEIPPQFRPDLAIKRDPHKLAIEKVVKADEAMEAVAAAAKVEMPVPNEVPWDSFRSSAAIW